MDKRHVLPHLASVKGPNRQHYLIDASVGIRASAVIVLVESLETWGQAEMLGVSSALDQRDSRSLVSGTFFQCIYYKYKFKVCNDLG